MPTLSPVLARRSSLDLLRVVAIAAVVIGHWLLIDISYRDGRVSGANALAAIPSTAPLTLLFQVMPVFFLVGGYLNAGSWRAWRDDGGGWGTWAAARAKRLLRPASRRPGGRAATDRLRQPPSRVGLDPPMGLRLA
jgi:peptidoglycan/LPS O-acetylase OafA/YrhL